MKIETGYRKLNLTGLNEENEHSPQGLKNISTLDSVNKFIRCLLADLVSSDRLNTIKNAIDTIVVAEDNASNDKINVDNVAVIIDTLECDFKSVVSLNTYYHTFDISESQKLSYFEQLKVYGESLKFPQYDFFKVALKAMCSAGIKISSLDSKVTNFSEFEYQNQNFLELIKKIIENLEFSLLLNGFRYDITCDLDSGYLKVNDKKVVNIVELSDKKGSVMTEIYNQQFKL